MQNGADFMMIIAIQAAEFCMWYGIFTLIQRIHQVFNA